MDLRDALSIAALGMSVVFAGLSLTALLIVCINGVPGLANRLSYRPGPPEAQRSTTAFEAPLEPEIVTVIATVLEVEHRLHHAERGGRLTISHQP